eukprot:m.341040 g.341040  ORF g.341040 m.341040 type:complete len:536 (-) comp19769_c0_seq1:215-1822(-)
MPTDVELIVQGDSSDDTASAARSMGFRVSEGGKLSELEEAQIIPMTDALLKMLTTETRVRFLDEYVFLLTGLRVYNEAVRKDANTRIVKATKSLIKPYQLGFKENPNGYTAPELVSMWSSILNDEGLGRVAPYFSVLVPVVTPCVTSSTVGSVVAAILIANLVGDSDDQADKLLDALPLLTKALRAALNGTMYAERQWGPGPISRCFASLTISDINKRRVYELELSPLFTEIIRKPLVEWKKLVESFDDEYYMTAKASASKVLWNLSLKHDVEAHSPDVLKVLTDFLANKDLSDSAKSNAHVAKFRIEQYSMQHSDKSQRRPLHSTSFTAEYVEAEKAKRGKFGGLCVDEFSSALFDTGKMPQVILSYSTDSCGLGVGKTVMWGLANQLKKAGIESFNGYQVPSGADWQEVWYGILNDRECKVVLALISQRYFESKACVNEFVAAIKAEDKLIIPLFMENVDIEKLKLPDSFGLTPVENRLRSNFIRQALMTNRVPPPDQGYLQQNTPGRFEFNPSVFEKNCRTCILRIKQALAF